MQRKHFILMVTGLLAFIGLGVFFVVSHFVSLANKDAHYEEATDQSEREAQQRAHETADPTPPTVSETVPISPSGGFSMRLPVACRLGEDCWIARYADRATGDAKADYRCGPRSQNDHRGTDFALRDYPQMRRGVDVLAVADGTVLRFRDGMQDTAVTNETAGSVRGRMCGNGLVIRHANGFETQYCHMKSGSLTVGEGDPVRAGEKIGEVGLSGFTEFPHLHLNVFHEGKRIDPFDGHQLASACSAKPQPSSLWANPISYSEMDLLPLTFSAAPLDRQSRWAGQAPTILASSDLMVLTGRAWNVLKGDRWTFSITRPDGTRATHRSMTVDKNRQSQWYWNQLKPPTDGFMPGVWKGRLLVQRTMDDGSVKRFQQSTSVVVTK